MAISENDAGEYLDALRKILEKHQLSWITEQAEDVWALGKTEKKTVPPEALEISPQYFRGDERTPVRPKIRRKLEELLTTQQLSNAEKLQVLLSAIVRALSSPANMEKAIFSSVEGDTQKISFVSETDQHNSHTLTRSELPLRLETAQRLRQAIEKISEQTR